MCKSRCYLAGPITGLGWKDCTDWRDGVEEKLSNYGILGLSPLRGTNYLSQEQCLKDNYNEHVMSTAKGITYRDMNDVRQSDVILVNLLGAQKVSIGTMLEISAAFVLNKPIVLVMEEGNIHTHAMVMTMCGWIVQDLEKAIEIVAYITGASYDLHKVGKLAAKYIKEEILYKDHRQELIDSGIVEEIKPRENKKDPEIGESMLSIKPLSDEIIQGEMVR
jgi:nucleoside 2-deoxyribosyltransferase